MSVASADRLLELFEAHEVLTEHQDQETVLKVVELLSANDIKEIERCPSLLASINTCLHSKSSRGITNGLIVLQWLCKECSDQLFSEQAINWIKISWTILQRNLANLSIPVRLLCSIFRILFRRAPAFPEVGRHCTTFVSALIELLVKYAESNHQASENCLDTIQVLFQVFPGSCGASCPLIDKFILSNLKPQSTVSMKSLARAYALMPSIGGGGKEGMYHKSNYVTLFQRLSYTLQDVLDEIFSISLSGNGRKVQSMSNSANPQPVPSLLLSKPPSNLDLLQKALHLQSQYEGLALCLIELIAVPFPRPKSIRPVLLLSVLKKAFDQSLPQLTTLSNHSHEAKILLLLTPSILVSSINILITLIDKCGTAMLPFAQMYLEVISGIFGDMRYFESKPSVDLKVANYLLLSKVCKSWGAAAATKLSSHGKDLVAYILSDILPKDDTKLITKPVKKDKKQRKQTKVTTTSLKWTTTKLWNDKLVESALKCLTEVMQSVGPMLEESVYRQIQCALLAIVMEHENKLTTEANCQLYQALAVMLAQGHCRASPSLHLLSHIFQRGVLNEASRPQLKNVCRHGLQLCTQQMHPSRSSMHLDLPMDVKTIEDIKKESMKVHVFYMDSQGIGNETFENRSAEDGVEEVGDNSQEDEGETVFEQDEVTIERDKLTQINSSIMKRRRQPSEIVTDKDEEDVPSVEESKKLNKDAYNLDEEPIFIPEGLDAQRRQKDHKENKIPRLSSDADFASYLDTKTMIEDFVPVLKS